MHSKKIIEDDDRVRALNKQFGKNASLDPIDQVYTNYDEEKKDNEYSLKLRYRFEHSSLDLNNPGLLWLSHPLMSYRFQHTQQKVGKLLR